MSALIVRQRVASVGLRNNAMNVVELPIALDHEKLAAFCRERGICKLSLFGSVLRDDFDSERSDVDVLAEFSPDVHPGIKFFGYA